MHTSAESPDNRRYLGRWFRFYASAIDDTKVQMLPDALFRTWVNILCLASTADGAVPSGKELAFRLRMSEALTKKRVDALIAADLIDRTGAGLTPHNWDERQFRSDSSAARMRAFRNRKNGSSGDGLGDAHVTSHRTAATEFVTSPVTAK